ncbi:hypothetical protein HA50_22935 [Pantoea cypripedii]|uniref:Uncharacterized protein n=1 Tax=Pantoea cypripedii TaxID=55209 RepID=A0A1X1EKM9_PANCY|nr:hypothetical protein HA50_22935 [Pantoea cypripedii]
MSGCNQPHQQKAATLPHMPGINEIVIRGSVVVFLPGVPGQLKWQIDVDVLYVRINGERWEVKRRIPPRQI